MDFSFDDGHPDLFQHEVKLVETTTHEVFYDKLSFIYLEMPKFAKNENELITHFDKWLYLLKNLNQFREIPSVLQERIFRKVFDIAEISNLNEEEMKTYEASLKDKRDWKNVIDTAREEERKKRNHEIAQNLLERGMSIDEVSEISNLSIKEVTKIAKKLGKSR